MENTQRRGMWIGAAVGVLGLAMIFLPPLLGADMMDLGYGLAFVGVFIALTAFIVVFVYWRRFKAMDRLISGEGVLVHWTYDSETWRRYAEVSYQRKLKENQPKLILVAVLMLVVGAVIAVPMFLDESDGLLPFLGIYFGAFMVIFLVAMTAPRMEYQYNLSHLGEALIGTEGLIVNGQLHHWKSLGGRLEGIKRVDGDPALLAFRLSYPNRYGRQEYEICVPIPMGREAEADRVMGQLGGRW